MIKSHEIPICFSILSHLSSVSKAQSNRNIAIEHGHRNSWFTYWTWWFSIAILVYQKLYNYTYTYTYIYIYSHMGSLSSIHSHSDHAMSSNIHYWSTSLSWTLFCAHCDHDIKTPNRSSNVIRWFSTKKSLIDDFLILSKYGGFQKWWYPESSSILIGFSDI